MKDGFMEPVAQVEPAGETEVHVPLNHDKSFDSYIPLPFKSKEDKNVEVLFNENTNDCSFICNETTP